MSFPKIENLYARDDETHKLKVGEYRRSDFAQIGSWLVLEKIDGTNIQLVYSAPGGHPQMEVKGRTDAAVLPKLFEAEAIPEVTGELLSDALCQIDDTGTVEGMVIYGEGYGPGIQKGGGDYATRKSLRIFDVVTYKEGSRPLWRTWGDVVLVADVLGLETAPVLGDGLSTAEIAALVRADLYSRVAAADLEVMEYEQTADLRRMEGVIARTDPYLFDYRGNRVLFKLKGHDLAA